MPDYKKKKKHYRPINRSHYNRDFDDVKMVGENRKPKTKSTAGNEFTVPRVIKGKKQKRIARAKVVSVFSAILIIAVLILKLLFPIGVIETLQHFFKTLGVGDFPVEIADNEVIDVSCNSNTYAILTSARVYTVTNSGKILSDLPHGYNNPVVKTSNTRYLVYGQGKNEYDIYVNGDKRFSKSLDSGIICADISDSGVFAVATYSKSYASTVNVYNLKGKNIFNWNSATDIINSVAVSKNGKKLAVSTLNTKGGKKYSKIHIFNFKNTDSENTYTFDDDFVYNLVSNSKGFFAVMNKSFTFINWNNKEKFSEKSDYSIKFFKNRSKISVAVFTRGDNQYDNIIYVLGNNGKVINKFKYSGAIKDISLKGSRVFVYADSKVTLFNGNAEIIGTVKCDDLGRKIIATDSKRFSLIYDNKINSFEIK